MPCERSCSASCRRLTTEALGTALNEEVASACRQRRSLVVLLRCAGLRGDRPRRSPLRQAQHRPIPTRPVRVIVPFAPGGATDIVTRVVAQKLNETWGQTRRRRQPRRRGRQHRRRHRRESAARRLHAAHDVGLDRHREPAHVQEAAVQPREGSRRDHERRERTADRRGAPELRGEDAEGLHRAREGEAAQR